MLAETQSRTAAAHKKLNLRAIFFSS